MNAFQKDALRTEAIARITWGESPNNVRDWLRDSGISRRQANSLICKCVGRRSREMRVFGTVNLFRGIWSLAAAVVSAIGAWYLLELLVPPGPGRSYVTRFCAVFFAPALILAIYGCGQIWLALDRLIFGARADGPVTDIED